MSAKRQPVLDASAWKGSDITSKDQVAFDLGPKHLQAFEDAILYARAEGLGIPAIGRSAYHFPAIADDIAALGRELTRGRGLLLIRGWPIDKYSLDEIGLLYGWFGQQWGHPVIQSGKGDRLGYVADVPQPGKIYRGYRSNAELRMHSDSDDIVGLLCMRKAKSGGVSRLVSGTAVYNEILRTRPDLLEILIKGFRLHWNGEEAPGEPPVTEYRVPIFSEVDGQVSISFGHKYIEDAFEALGVPPTAQETEALALLEATAGRSDLVYEFQLEPGENSFINNYTTLHSRTGFEDHPEEHRRRLLLRLWLKAHDARSIDANLRRYYGNDGMAATENVA